MEGTRYSDQILIKIALPQNIVEEYSKIKFHENTSSGSRVAPCGQTDMTKLIVAFRKFYGKRLKMRKTFGWEEGQKVENVEDINIYKGMIFITLLK